MLEGFLLYVTDSFLIIALPPVGEPMFSSTAKYLERMLGGGLAHFYHLCPSSRLRQAVALRNLPQGKNGLPQLGGVMGKDFSRIYCR